jgi:hypothetical protein
MDSAASTRRRDCSSIGDEGDVGLRHTRWLDGDTVKVTVYPSGAGKSFNAQ